MPIDASDRSGSPGMAGGSARLLQEAGDPPGVVDRHDAELPGLRPGHRQAGDGQVGPVVAVEVDHPRVVHLVDVVAGQDHVSRGAAFSIV